jgi:hypothetical protein
MQVSISSTFFARFLHTKVLFCQNVTGIKLPKRLSYEKRARKTLMKLMVDYLFLHQYVIQP